MVERVLFAPGGATEAKQDTTITSLATLLTELQQKLETGQAVALDAATLAALETINAVVSGTVALDATTLAALEQITVSFAAGQIVRLDAASLAALESITATISGTVTVTGPLTDTQLRATPVPVSGTVATTGSLTDAQLRAADVNVADSGEREYTHVVATVTTAGDTTIHTPAAGKRVRLHWIYAINDPVATTTPLIKVKLGASEKYRVWALSKRQLVTGPTDGALVINLGVTGTVACTALLEEVT